MLFDNWTDIFRTLIVGVLAYFTLLALLRLSGKRTLSQMSAFDLVVTVAIGSVLATIILSEDVALAEGVVAYITLIGLQFMIEWTSVRSKTVRDLVKGYPQLLFYRGAFLEREMRRERVDRQEILAAIRDQGIADLNDVEAVVLETNGVFTVLERPTSMQQSTLQDVQGAQARRAQPR